MAVGEILADGLAIRGPEILGEQLDKLNKISKGWDKLSKLPGVVKAGGASIGAAALLVGSGFGLQKAGVRIPEAAFGTVPNVDLDSLAANTCSYMVGEERNSLSFSGYTGPNDFEGDSPTRIFLPFSYIETKEGLEFGFADNKLQTRRIHSEDGKFISVREIAPDMFRATGWSEKVTVVGYVDYGSATPKNCMVYAINIFPAR